VRAHPERAVTLGALAAAARVQPAESAVAPSLEVTRYFRPPDLTYASGAQAVSVEIDPDTGAARLLGCWIAHDSGRLINPMIVEGQIHGGMAQGLGGALLEELVFDEHGQLATGSLMDYALPRATDVPPIEISHLGDALAGESARREGRGRVGDPAGGGGGRLGDRGRAQRARYPSAPHADDQHRAAEPAGAGAA
jgi:CO/xanthine dehydrogenase Mo-binding subunit